MIQRLLDVVLSSFALIVLAPVLLAVALILSFTGEGEIIYRQARVGKGRKAISLFKFATMLKESPSIGTGTVTVKNDPRVLPVGRVLRASKINELPQLINIWIGDMSFVGPRPQTERCFDVFPDEDKPIISSVRPGLSGLGSIVFRDEENILAANENSIRFYDEVIAPYKGKVEVYGVRKNSIPMYFMVIFATLWVVIYPSSSLIWRLMPDLPKPPESLRELLDHK